MAKQIADMITGLRCDRRSNDRRREPRVGLRARVTVTDTDVHRRTRCGWIRDLSRGGAGLLLADPVAVDRVMALRVPIGDQQTFSARARVVHCEKVAGFHRVGVEFVRTRGPLDALLDSGMDEFEALAEYMRGLRLAVTG